MTTPLLLSRLSWGPSIYSFHVRFVLVINFHTDTDVRTVWVSHTAVASRVTFHQDMINFNNGNALNVSGFWLTTDLNDRVHFCSQYQYCRILTKQKPQPTPELSDYQEAPQVSHKTQGKGRRSRKTSSSSLKSQERWSEGRKKMGRL